MFKNKMFKIKNKYKFLFKMRSYSSVDNKGESLDIKLVKLFNRKKNGFYVELGANDGLRQSNTKLLEDYFEWTGVLIEPSPLAFEHLKRNRPNNILINECAVHVSGTIKGDFTDGSLMASVDGTRQKNKFLIEVPARPLSDMLKDHNDIDIMIIDTEGYELEVIKGLGKIRPKFLLVEIYSKDFDTIISYLKTLGYELVCNMTNYNVLDNPQWDKTHNDYLFKIK